METTVIKIKSNEGKGVKMIINRDGFCWTKINDNQVELHYKPITSKSYIRNIILYKDGSFTINENCYSRNQEYDLKVLRSILPKDKQGNFDFSLFFF